MSENSKWPYRLMTPGPVPLTQSVIQELSAPMIHHRTAEFKTLLRQALDGLKKVFQTQQPVFILTSAGSGAMEAAVVNTLSPGDEVLCIVSGKFGERWAAIANAYGMKVQLLEVPWGENFSLENLSEKLSNNPNLKAVFFQASETSTGTAYPVKEIAALIHKKSQALVAVDAITALGAMELPMDKWGLDVVVAGSQKAFALPTGLGFISLSERAWKAYSEAKSPRYYFDLGAEKEANKKDETYFSSAVSHIRALNAVLSENMNDLPALKAKIEKLSAATRAGAEALGFKVYGQNPSPAVTAMALPDELHGDELKKLMFSRYNISIGGGQSALKGKIIRIGHLGAITGEDLLATFEALGLCLKELNWSGYSDEKLEATLTKMKECLA